MADMLDLLPAKLPAGVVYEKADASGPYAVDRFADPSVLVVLKTAVCDQVFSGEKRPHVAILEGRPLARPALSADQWAKAVPGPCFGAYRRLRPWLGMNWPADSDRDIDVFFAGSVKTFKGPLLEHRRAMVLQAPDRSVIHAGRELPIDDYRAAMLRSRIALVPWGWGELSHRLYEAWHAGCVPIMPATWWVNTWYGKLQADRHYVACRPDWLDLADVCARVLGGFGRYQAMRERNHKLAASLLSDERLALWWRGLAHHG